MYLFKRILCYLVVCFSLTVNAQPVVHSETTVTPQWISERQLVITNAQTTLEKAQAALQAKEQSQREQIAALEQADKITEKMLEEAAQKRQAANQKVEKRRLERQQTQAQLDQQLERLTALQTKLEKLTQYPRAELTVAQNQRISEVENTLALQKQAIELEKQYLDILKKQSALAIKQTVLAIEWHSQLQTVPQLPLIKDQKQAIVDAQTTLERNQESLQKAQENLPNQIASLEQLTFEKLTKRLDKAALDRDAAEVELNNFVLERQSTKAHLETQQKDINEQQEKLEERRKTPPPDPEQLPIQEKRISEREAQLDLQKKRIELETQNLDIIDQRIEHAEKRLKLATEWHDKLQAVYPARQKQALEHQMRQAQQRHLSRAAELRWQLNKVPESEEYAAQRELLGIQIQEANEQALQVERKFKREHLQEQLQRWQQTAQERQEATDISEKQIEDTLALIEKVKLSLQEFQAMQELLQSKMIVLEKQQNVVAKRGETLQGNALKDNKKAKKQLATLKKTLQQELDQIPSLLEKGEEVRTLLENAYKANLSLVLSKKRELPTSTAEWQILLGDLRTIPNFFMQQWQLAGRGFLQAFQQTPTQGWLTLGVVTLIWLSFVMGMSVLFRRLSLVEERSGFINRRLLGMRLWRMNTVSIGVVGMFLLLLWLTQPASLSLIVTLILLLTWLGGKLLLNLFWLWLSELDPKLYRQLRWIIVVLGILTVITALVHVEDEGYVVSLSLTTRELFDSLFMILLSLTVLPLLRMRKIILASLPEKAYWRLVTQLLTLLLPLVVLAISILGLIGYISLGWSVAKLLSLFFLVLTGWLIVHGFMTDLIKLLKNGVSKDSRFYELWTEDLVPLMEKLLGLLLFGLAVLAFFWLNGWYSNVAVKDNIAQFLNFSLFSLGEGKKVTVENVLLAIVLIWAVFWLGSWSRRLGYRWIYLTVTDTGIRHSLSVFTQYMVVLIGLLIVLKVIGIDPTTLTVFAGAVGIGIGFGLQHVASNFLSGLILLVERPLRVDDYVEIAGSHCGTVARIGMNNTTLQMPDRQDVIIPNSELIARPFINRTRTDHIMRTTLYVGISYEDDPHKAENIIKSVLDEVPEILTDPGYDIFLWEFADSRVTFRINYFLDLRDVNMFGIKSTVLFNIWDSFEKAGIKIPFPQQDVHLKSVQGTPDKI